MDGACEYDSLLDFGLDFDWATLPHKYDMQQVFF